MAGNRVEIQGTRGHSRSAPAGCRRQRAWEAWHLSERCEPWTATSQTQAFQAVRARIYTNRLELPDDPQLVTELSLGQNREVPGRIMPTIEIPKVGRSLTVNLAVALAAAVGELDRNVGGYTPGGSGTREGRPESPDRRGRICETTRTRPRLRDWRSEMASAGSGMGTDEAPATSATYVSWQGMRRRARYLASAGLADRPRLDWVSRTLSMILGENRPEGMSADASRHLRRLP